MSICLRTRYASAWMLCVSHATNHQWVAHNIYCGIVQVLDNCTDARTCFFVSVFMLEHLMLNRQDQYWHALRQLVVQAQQVNNEGLLGNPYLQVSTLLSLVG